MSREGNRRWSLDAAREVLADVRGRTAEAVAEAEALMEAREASAPDSQERARVEARLRKVASGWARAMEALGLEVKGLWLVDFDNGSGFYCWRWPEEELGWYHGYDEGFAGRTRIQ